MINWRNGPIPCEMFGIGLLFPVVLSISFLYIIEEVFRSKYEICRPWIYKPFGFLYIGFFLYFVLFISRLDMGVQYVRISLDYEFRLLHIMYSHFNSLFSTVIIVIHWILSFIYTVFYIVAFIYICSFDMGYN